MHALVLKREIGMLRRASEPLEGSNILWHIVGPSPPTDFLSLS